MARTTNYSKKIEKIKSQLDELGAVINSIQNNSNDAENPSQAINIKALDIDRKRIYQRFNETPDKNRKNH